MGSFQARIPGRTLDSREGSADLRAGGLGYTVRRTLLTGAAVAGLISAVAATSAALQGEVDPGVVPDPQAGIVVGVSPNGFAWRDGIRAGQTIVSLSTADSPGGWRIETREGTERFMSSAAPMEAALRESLPFALGSLTISVLG